MGKEGGLWSRCNSDDMYVARLAAKSGTKIIVDWIGKWLAHRRAVRGRHPIFFGPDYGKNTRISGRQNHVDESEFPYQGLAFFVLLRVFSASGGGMALPAICAVLKCETTAARFFRQSLFYAMRERTQLSCLGAPEKHRVRFFCVKRRILICHSGRSPPACRIFSKI